MDSAGIAKWMLTHWSPPTSYIWPSLMVKPEALAKKGMWFIAVGARQAWVNSEPFTLRYTFPIPYSYTTHVYNHDSDGPQNLVTSKGSLPLPVRLSTRLLVACKSRESKKKKSVSECDASMRLWSKQMPNHVFLMSLTNGWRPFYQGLPSHCTAEF